MLIKSFRVENYKSYRDTADVPLQPGFNLVVGQNNVGKTALVEALSLLQVASKPHRSEMTLPTRETVLNRDSRVTLVLQLTPQESEAVLREIPKPFLLPRLHNDETAVDALDRLLKGMQDGFELECTFSMGVGRWVATKFFGQPIGEGTQNLTFFQTDMPNNDARKLTAGTIVGGNHPSSLPFVLAAHLRQRLYAFKAERLNVAESAQGTDPILAADARNLAQVLNLLQTSNPARWQKLLAYLRTIFPDITEITVPVTPEGNVRILVWSVDADTERDDLAISLADSGTGIGQVLMMLYVVLTANSTRPIVIDEPQSFLHPGAIRKLFDILRLYSHQFIVITHSPTVVDAAMPRSLILVRHIGAESELQHLSAFDTDDLRAFLNEVGARPSDVFGADRVLWVEGKTEESALPLILAAHPEVERGATAILSVRNTGDFLAGDAKAIIEIYHRLSQGPRLMPPTVGFFLDRELLTETEVADLQRQSKGLLKFTKRRMFENYLLNSTAVASVINSIEAFPATPISPDAVEEWFVTHRWDAEFFKPKLQVTERSTETWLRHVNGALVLQKVFAELSKGRVQYDKVRHGAALTASICAHAVEEFTDIVDVVSSLIKVASSVAPTKDR